MEMNKHIMNMSLDEIIARRKMSGDMAFSSIKTYNRNFTKCDGRNNIKQEDEDVDMLPCSASEEYKEGAYTEIWKGPEATVAYIDCHDPKNDLREKLNSKHKVRVSTIQYRLQYPNNTPDRPLGIPTLLPMSSGEPSPQRATNYCYRPYRQRNQGYNNYVRRTDNNTNAQDNSNNSRSYNEGNHNSRKNTRITISNSGKFDGPQTDTRARNLFIKVPSSFINLNSGAPMKSCFQVPKSDENKSMPIGGITPQAQAVLDLGKSQNFVSNTNNDNLKNLLGYQDTVSEETIPVYASKLQELVENGVKANKHKPIYDMQLQKQIHEIQHKPMLYKCNGAEVISSEGAGVNCKITPRTSGVSLSCRFA